MNDLSNEFRAALYIGAVTLIVLFLAAVLILPALQSMDAKSVYDTDAEKALEYGRAGEHRKAIEIYERLSETMSKEQFPYEYACIQNGLGANYGILSEGPDREQNMERAAGHFSQALTIFTKDKYPQEFAANQKSRGVALQALGEIRNNSTEFAEAVTAFSAASEIYTESADPVEYAKTQAGLGYCYGRLAFDRNPEENSRRSREAFGNALRITTIEKYPYAYAQIQSYRGRVTSPPESITAYNEALRIFTAAQYPEEYADTQAQLGNIYQSLGNEETGNVNITLAEQAYLNTLTVWNAEELS